MKKKKLWVALIAIFIVAIVTTNCKKDEYEEITGECPIVVSTSPANLETGVILEKIITVTFNTKMNEATITQAAFTLNASSKKNGEADEIRVEGVLTYNATNNTMSFVPLVKLAPNTTYTGRVLTSVKEIHGNALQTPYTWTFSTGSFVPPTVISTVPRNAAVNVGTNTKVSATFSESMNPLTITASTFTLKHGSTLVNGLVTYAGNTSTFSPSSPLAANTIYTATITTGAQNTVGTAMSSNYVWSFTTGSVPDETPPVVILTVPGNLSTDVMINSRLLATFSEAMDHLSITDASFTLKNGITAVPASVSYTGVVATLRPLTVLTPNTLYTATITTAAKDLAGNQMEQNYIWTFTTGAVPDIVAPTVIVTVPENMATGVAFNARPSAIFSEAMDPLTINHLTFLIKQGTTPIAGVITYSGISAVFTPLSNFAANTVYSATITNEVEDLAGNKMVNNYNWSFTTGSAPDNTPPTVIAVFPLNQALNVTITTSPTASFSELMDPLSINAATFKIKQGSTPIAGSVILIGHVATFTPGSNFAANTVYTATITNNVEDLAGNAMVNDYVWSFTTAPAPDLTAPNVISTLPANLATNVAVNVNPTATFSELMDPLTINASSFTLKQGANSVTGNVSYAGSTATFVPAASLTGNTLYTATIVNTVKDLAGNNMVNNYVWTFTTGMAPDLTTPTVIATIPLNLATNVPLNVNPTATFSELMDPLTINASSFTLKQGANAINGSVSYAGSTATFVPAASLAGNTLYTATIVNTVKDLAGNNMVNNYVWTFTTGIAPDLTAPNVISTLPANLSTNVAVNVNPTATFSELMDPLTINASSFTLKQGANIINGVVTYAGSTATFDPASSLAGNTLYTATIVNTVKDLAGNNMVVNYVWTFTTGIAPDLTAPTVIATVPLNLATNVPVNVNPTATFSELMDPLTINASSFTLKQGANIINGVVTYAGSTATFDPTSSLAGNTLYTATIVNTVKDLAGNNMVNNYVWTFTTGIAPDLTAPNVISTFPANLATNVPVNVNPTATFSELMDPLTINASSFTLKQGANSVTGNVSYAGSTATFVPAASLAGNTLYTATIVNTVKDLAGNNMVNNYVWTFTTGNAPDLTAPNVISTLPANLATNVAVNVNPTATFSELMDPLTINASSFTLKQGANSVTGNVSYAGSTATFVPAASLAGNTLYTATIVNTVKDLAGNNMVNNYVWTFTTVSLPAPTVISTDPVNLGTGVQLNKVITADFSEMMNPLTINGASFTLKIGTTPVDGQVSYSGVKATFTPTSNLSSATTYIATITTVAENLTGIPLENDYEWTFTTVNAAGAPFVDLKSVARFGIIAGVGISNNAGFSVINDQDVGISPGVRSSITGFPPAIVVNGAIYASDDIAPPGVGAMLAQAKLDLTEAYLFAEGATVPAPATVSGDQGGLTLYPGIYKSTSTLLIQSGDLTLDAQGDENAVWIFQVAAGFTTVGGAGGNVILSGGAQAKNVFWQTGSSATIGDNTSFKGNILALTSITMNSGAVAQGRMLCSNGSIVLTNTNIINKP